MTQTVKSGEAAMTDKYTDVAVGRRKHLIGSWADDPCWYCSVQDAGRTALILGPFRTEAACRQWAYRDATDGGSDKHNLLVKLACDRDAKAWFYSWGMVKYANGYRDGVMNNEVFKAWSERMDAESKQTDPLREMQSA